MADSVNGILDELTAAAAASGEVSIGEVSEAFGSRGAAPFLIVPPLLVISPLGGVPLLPTLMALLVAVFAAQIAFGRAEPRIPRFLARRTVEAKRLREAADWMRPVADRVDRWFRNRLKALTARRVQRGAMLVVLVLCALVPPLELVPFAAGMPMAPVLLFGLALLFGDGLLMAAAFVTSLAALGGAGWFLVA